MPQHDERRAQNADPHGGGSEVRTWRINLVPAVLWVLGATLGMVACIAMSIAVLGRGDAGRLMVVFWMFAVVCGLIAAINVAVIVVQMRARRVDRDAAR
ncbi:hypothetical protein [Microbacterium karelineae]|uniref:hypothetical protein n=1 Tax=Microbacterium karelineae TaxID=2654283 RepID=UPI0012EABCB1|nr:hypothetical protein [Microbacterium karelineae]